MSFRNFRAAFVVLGVFALAAPIVRAQLQYPEGTENFESLAVGADGATLFDWVMVNSSVPPDQFKVKAADDVQGNVQPHNFSTRWLRFDDQDGTNVQNRFYSPTIVAPTDQDYAWTYFVNLESVPSAGAATKPRIVVQHLAPGFANVWGIEFSDAGAKLFVTGAGGPAASTPLYSLVSPTGIGDWVRIRLSVNFEAGRVYASANGGVSVSLPIVPAANLDKKTFRWCYRGEGTDNASRILVDDVNVQVGDALPTPTVSGWGLIVLTLLLLTGAKVFFRNRTVEA